MNRLLCLAGYLTFFAFIASAEEHVGLPHTIYEEWRKSPFPADGGTALINPPSLQWASVKHWEGRDVRYRVELSTDATFPAGSSIKGDIQRACFFNPHVKLAAGTWYWRYEIQDGANRVMKGPYKFLISAATPQFESPTFAALLAKILNSHPFIVTQGRSLSETRVLASGHPMAREIIEQGRKSAKMNVYDGPLSDSDPARSRALEQVTKFAGAAAGSSEKAVEAVWKDVFSFTITRVKEALVETLKYSRS